ncbi:MAG: hypothetical protein AVDCRST_MAG03-2315 [uncultured Rubrobacteraceae bacterium]|uniref:Uncharacterized protein n=1 Tax=uncultured Rubrobacteraceae bacterium TaxID=349277 RepID=A0A6J4PK49_9ACTN|nr:MAG: hypothetical protein AVDCRST_MAG03-2315 [uncultured Rubrobacteraceae bacterium]
MAILILRVMSLDYESRTGKYIDGQASNDL